MSGRHEGWEQKNMKRTKGRNCNKCSINSDHCNTQTECIPLVRERSCALVHDDKSPFVTGLVVPFIAPLF